jgi:thioesterase domain-containing protein/acyl carrier protein
MTAGRLQPGERVLIHAAAGGVGLAAVHVCRWRACEIFATAGRPEKQDYLHSLGVRHVMSSRTLDFAGQVMERTRGRGVDVVLNSLAGDFIPAGLSVLAPFGRFLELGIRDVLADTRIGLKPFARGLTYSLILAGPGTPGYAAAWQEMAALVRDGRLPPLPVRTFPAGEVRQAFEFMAQARHIGKIVVEKSAEPGAADITAEESPATASGDGGAPAARDARPAPEESGGQGAAVPGLASGLTNAEGAEAFLRVLALGLPQVAVACSPLDEAEGGRDRPPAVGGVLATAAPMPSPPREASLTGYTPPRGELEKALVRIWENTLGIQPVGIHDNFFDLGGDSLVAVTLFDEIRQTLGRGLQISLLFEAPTIARMAEALGGRLPAEADGPTDATRNDGLPAGGEIDPAPLRAPNPAAKASSPETVSHPLIFVHNIYGEILAYRAITRHLLPEFQVRALAAPIAGESYRQCHSVEELAAGYIRRVQADHPVGPCLLLGHSVGGLLAFEMARQLAAAGREAPFLGLLDARLIHPPDGLRRFADPACLGHYLRNLPHWAAQFARSRGKRWSLIRERFHHLLGVEDPEWLKTVDPAHAEYMCWLMGLLRRYQPGPYGGRVVLFRVRALPLLSWSREDLGWGRLTCTAPEVRFIPGDHATMLREPDVAGLAAELKSALAAPPRERIGGT